MDKSNVALTKLAIGLMSVGAVAGIAGRLASGVPGQGAALAPDGVAPGILQSDIRSDVPVDRFSEEDPYGGELEQRWQSDFRLAPPGQAERGGIVQRRRTRSRAS